MYCGRSLEQGLPQSLIFEVLGLVFVLFDRVRLEVVVALTKPSGTVKGETWRGAWRSALLRLVSQ